MYYILIAVVGYTFALGIIRALGEVMSLGIGGVV